VFRFKREQSIVNVAGVKFGGQPGEQATVLCGTIFYQGQRIVENEEKGVFDKAAAERLILRQLELSEETGCPSVLHIFARTSMALEKYIDFAEQVWTGPIILDSADPCVRSYAAAIVTELGYADKSIYNSISLATKGEEAEAIRDSEIDSAIVLAYNPTEPGVDGAMRILETGGSVNESGLIPFARELGIVNLFIDPGAMPLGSGGGAALRFSVVAKARLGLPVGSGIHNAVSAWPWLMKKDKITRKSCDAAAAAMQLLAAGDFLLYGPIENAEFIFPAAAMADILIAEAVRDLEVQPGGGHPFHKLV
jgi:tetrahydromethanopterin S-methyltransferase subunit H